MSDLNDHGQEEDHADRIIGITAIAALGWAAIIILVSVLHRLV